MWFSKMRAWTYSFFRYGSLALRFLPDRRRRSSTLRHASHTRQCCGALPLLRGQIWTTCCLPWFTKQVTSGLYSCFDIIYIQENQNRGKMLHSVQLAWCSRISCATPPTISWTDTLLSVPPLEERNSWTNFFKCDLKKQIFKVLLKECLIVSKKKTPKLLQTYNKMNLVWWGNTAVSCSMTLSKTVLPACSTFLSGRLCGSRAAVAPASAAEGCTYRGELWEDEGTGFPRVPLGCNNREIIWLETFWNIHEGTKN